MADTDLPRKVSAKGKQHSPAFNVLAWMFVYWWSKPISRHRIVTSIAYWLLAAVIAGAFVGVAAALVLTGIVPILLVNALTTIAVLATASVLTFLTVAIVLYAVVSIAMWIKHKINHSQSIKAIPDEEQNLIQEEEELQEVSDIEEEVQTSHHSILASNRSDSDVSLKSISDGISDLSSSQDSLTDQGEKKSEKVFDNEEEEQTSHRSTSVSSRRDSDVSLKSTSDGTSDQSSSQGSLTSQHSTPASSLHASNSDLSFSQESLKSSTDNEFEESKEEEQVVQSEETESIDSITPSADLPVLEAVEKQLELKLRVRSGSLPSKGIDLQRETVATGQMHGQSLGGMAVMSPKPKEVVTNVSRESSLDFLTPTKRQSPSFGHLKAGSWSVNTKRLHKTNVVPTGGVHGQSLGGMAVMSPKPNSADTVIKEVVTNVSRESSLDLLTPTKRRSSSSSLPSPTRRSSTLSLPSPTVGDSPLPSPTNRWSSSSLPSPTRQSSTSSLPSPTKPFSSVSAEKSKYQINLRVFDYQMENENLHMMTPQKGDEPAWSKKDAVNAALEWQHERAQSEPTIQRSKRAVFRSFLELVHAKLKPLEILPTEDQYDSLLLEGISKINKLFPKAREQHSSALYQFGILNYWLTEIGQGQVGSFIAFGGEAAPTQLHDFVMEHTSAVTRELLFGVEAPDVGVFSAICDEQTVKEQRQARFLQRKEVVSLKQSQEVWEAHRKKITENEEGGERQSTTPKSAEKEVLPGTPSRNTSTEIDHGEHHEPPVELFPRTSGKKAPLTEKTFPNLQSVLEQVAGTESNTP